MRFALTFLGTAALLLPVLAKTASAEDSRVIWQTIDWPPFMTISRNSEDGQYARLLDILEEGLPTYRHTRRVMRWSRVWALIRSGQQVCNIFAFKNEDRELFAEFSAPFSIFLSNMVILRRDNLNKLNVKNQNQISLRDLLRKDGLRGVLETQRSYSSALDKILEAQQTGANYSRMAMSSESLIKIILKGRVDYVLEYPKVANYWRSRLPEFSGELVALPIAEISPTTFGHVACPKSEWGKNLIQRIDSLLNLQKPTARYRKIIEMMASNQAEIDQIRMSYPSFIGTTK